MNYLKHYDLLIDRAKQRTIDVYTEKHHIIPKCLGGTDDRSNLVDLTPEEHYVAHQLLIKIYNNPKLIHAAAMMTVTNRRHQKIGRGNKLYGWLRRRLQKIAKQRTGNSNGSFGKPWFHNPTTGESGKFKIGEEPNGWIRGRIAIKNNNCIKCNSITKTKLQKYCDACRKTLKEKTVIKNIKQKSEFTDEEKLQALKNNDWNIRRALFSLGLNDSGTHYKVMKRLKASVYPLATNQ